ncbi:MAG TPA: outer membrane beta-barrel protein [Xanthomonadales bacterium]|nr:outer membrane beta-barrel protein [Xanthomonadales bacterium]
MNRAVLLGLALAAPAAHAFDDHWFAGARGGIAVTDQDFDNDGTVWQGHVGRTFGERYAVELELTADEYDFGIDYGLKHYAIGFNHLTINREPLWDPYFLIGVGAIRYEAPDGNPLRGGTDAMFNLGVGGQWELVLPERVFLRADLRLRYDLNDTRQPGQNGFGDGIFTLGLVIPLGR